MTVIAWDGKTIAADKRGVTAGLCITTTKLRRLNTGEILAWTGDQDSGEMVAAWYAAGGNPMEWPACQQKEETWSRLIVATKETVKYFERQPIAITVEDPFAAWGSGAILPSLLCILGGRQRNPLMLLVYLIMAAEMV